MARIVSLSDAISELVQDGLSVAVEGFSHLVPFAAGHEILRQGCKDLELTRLVPDILYDQMVGVGACRKLVFSWAGNPGVGLLARVRAAVEHDLPRPVELEEHTHAGLAAAYVAGASNLPFAVLRGYIGTGLEPPRPGVGEVVCPFTGERLAAVRAIRPDVAIVHAQQADRDGNVMLWGVLGVQKEAVLAAGRSLVTVEEVVETLAPRPGAVLLPSWVIDLVALAPGGAYPSYAQGYYERDDVFYEKWDELSRDAERFAEWMQKHVLGVPNLEAHLASLRASSPEDGIG
jgi:glutaconate CoA-transferase subunit A